jgi:hypothetical protein
MARRSHTHTSATPSTHHSTPDTHTPTPQTHTPKPHDPATPSRTGQGGAPGDGKGYQFEPENLHTMEGRIGSTRQKVDGVGQKVASTNFGAQTMGVVGSGMTGTLNNALGNAQQQLTKASAAVEGARSQTKTAREAFDSTDRTNADALRRLQSDVDGTKTPGTSGATTAPNASGAGGALPDTPGGGGGSGSPPTPGSSSSAPPPRSWRDEIKDRFSPDEQRELDSALQKMAEEPRPGEVPGSGRLTQHERELVAQAQQLVTISPDTRMQKVIPPDDVQKYLDGKYSQVGGFVARQQDATHMSTPDQLVRGNRLDYTGTPYQSGMPEVHAIEFRAGAPGNYQIPLGAPYGGASGLDEAHPAVGRASDDMLTAARGSGLDPNGYRRNNAEWPYSGIGVTADADMGVPERTMSNRKDFEDGDMMYKYTAAGQKIPVARFDEMTGRWARL